MVHYFQGKIDYGTLPTKLNSPFDYTPHPLCIMASEHLMTYLSSLTDVVDELSNGKMFGVMVVEDSKGDVGYLCAFSGSIDGLNGNPYFVPPVFDILSPNSFFLAEQEEISSINREIECVENDEAFLRIRFQIDELLEERDIKLTEYRRVMDESKRLRDTMRENAPSLNPQVIDNLIKESQFQKAQFKRLDREYSKRIADLESIAEPFTLRIERLKSERKRRSNALQLWIFNQFKMVNGLGEERGLIDIFGGTVQKVPPAGAGECAAPKLMQYALKNSLKPLAIAEFWYGRSPITEVRHHGTFYTACKGKCEPILKHMLKGLEVDKPLSNKFIDPQIIFEDDHLIVVNKPYGVLSVPGNSGEKSVLEWLSVGGEVFMVHRLDMATSGLLMAAKSMDVCKTMQRQFASRVVEKRYTAVLEGIIDTNGGTISLPLAPDFNNRPRQSVDYVSGKTALTRYELVENRTFCIENEQRVCSVVRFFPVTGRTHQLRVHAAHHLGLNMPILGDTLYGRASALRMYLHADRLSFNHPFTGEKIYLRLDDSF